MFILIYSGVIEINGFISYLYIIVNNNIYKPNFCEVER